MYNKQLMALVYFYDATELDQKQLGAAFQGTDHHLEFVADKIEPANCNPEAEVISVFITSQVSRSVIEAMPKLRLIAGRSTGFNNIDLAAAQEHEVTVVNVPTYGEATVAEYVFTLLLALQRKLPTVLRTEREQFSSGSLMGRDLEGKVFGVVGTGHIGQKALKIADGFSMQTMAYDAFPKEELQAQYHFKYVELDELLGQADVVSLHTPYLPATHHLMNRDRLNKMKPGAILVNTARGELVDTEALIEVLENGQLGGAVIDVIEGEALLNYDEETALLRSDIIPEELLRHSVEINVLEAMPNVIISPHNAFNTVEAIQRINQTSAQNIIDFWYGKIPNKVTPAKPALGKLLIVRHTESEWNAVGKWTGLSDAHLDDNGFKESTMLGQALKKLDIHIDNAYCSEQIRTRETLEGILDTAQQFDVNIVVSPALNERDYGQYTGKNKWEVEKQIGEEAFDQIRRGWDVPVPGGETLKMVSERVVPFYSGTVLPLLQAGKNVLIVAHGNSLRALVKYLESISDQDVSRLEMLFGQIVVYDVSADGLKSNSQVVQIDITPPQA
jgi:D-lactate dehydrogenase